MIGEISNKQAYKIKKGEEKQMDINVILNNMEKFMSSSLDKLVSNLPNDAFKYTSEEIKNDKKLKLMKLKAKCVYPYD